MGARRVKGFGVAAALVVVTAAQGMASPTAGAQTEATERPAVITVDAVGAKLADDGRLRLTDVNPRALFQAEGSDATQLETYGLAKLLDTQDTVIAVLRADDDASGDAESERLKLSDITYDFGKGTLTADTESASETDARPLEDAAPNTDADGKLPDGPLELVVLDTDTEVADGQPLPPRSAASSPSYEVPLQIQYSGRLTPGRTIVGTVVSSQCITASGFRIDASGQRSYDTLYDAEKMKINTGIDCFFKVAHIEYNLSLEGLSLYENKLYVDGPIQLHVTQTGPRYFISSCTDKWPIESSCRVFLAPATPLVKVTM